MIDRSEFFQQPAWQSLVKKNFISDTRSFIDLEVTPSVFTQKVKIPLVLEELKIPGLGSVHFGRYSSVYLSDYFDFKNSEYLDIHSIEELRHKANDIGIDVLWFSNIPSNESLYSNLQEFSKSRKDCYFLDCIPSLGIKCYDTYEEYLSSLSKNSRRNIRRKNEAIKEIGAEHKVIPLGGEEIDLLLRNQFTRARNTNLDVIASNLPLSKTFKDMIGLKGVQMSEIFIDDKVISQLLLLVKEKTIAVLAQSFDEDYSQYSPGFCNFANLIAYAHGHGYKYIDLLRGDEDYKRHFSNHTIEMRKFVLILNPRLNPETLISFLQNIEE